MNKTTQVHQLLPGFTSGDAISNDAIEIQRIIKNWGHESKIFTVTRHTSPKVKHLCSDYTEYRNYSSKDNIVVYHHSIGSDIVEYFKNLPDKKVLVYHNITPDRYFRSINSEKALALYQGRHQLEELVKIPDLALADSEYNRQELADLGYKNTHVLPIIINFDSLKEKPKRGILNKYRDKFINFLFVGRITPNKKIEDVIKVFYYFKKTINISSRLFIVGSFVGMEKYYAYLKALVVELDLPNVIFTGHVTDEELISYYRICDIFICMSEHEGFCVPLIESMYFGVPIVAYSSAAVPYTLGGSGVLVGEKDYSKIAELINTILTNDNIRSKIIVGQKKRLEDFSRDKIEEEFYSILYNFIFS